MPITSGAASFRLASSHRERAARAKTTSTRSRRNGDDGHVTYVEHAFGVGNSGRGTVDSRLAGLRPIRADGLPHLPGRPRAPCLLRRIEWAKARGARTRGA